MYFFSSLAEIIGYASCHLNDYFSRKNVLIGFLGSASLMCLIVALIPTNSSITTESAVAPRRVVFNRDSLARQAFAVFGPV